MSVDFRTRNQAFLLKAETTAGTDASPTTTSDAIRINDRVQFTPSLKLNETNEVRESISAGPPSIGSGSGGFRGSCNLSGAGTAGTAPDWGRVLRACGMSETLTAADVSGTAQAGSTSSTIKLAAGASAVDDAYFGMVIEITGGTGNNQRAVITDYVGSTKVATVTPNWPATPDGTSAYAIRANALYIPCSQGLESFTGYSYIHGQGTGSQSKLRKGLGLMGTAQIAIQSGGIPTLAFTLSGLMPAAPTDVSKPTTAVLAGAAPESFRSANCYLGGAAMKMNSFSLDLGNKPSAFDDPSQQFGMDVTTLVGRQVQGNVVPPLSYTSTRDAFTDFISGNLKAIWLNWGSAVGKRVSILIPQAQYSGYQDNDTNGFASESLPFRANMGPQGDQEVAICVW